MTRRECYTTYPGALVQVLLQCSHDENLISRGFLSRGGDTPRTPLYRYTYDMLRTATPSISPRRGTTCFHQQCYPQQIKFNGVLQQPSIAPRHPLSQLKKLLYHLTVRFSTGEMSAAVTYTTSAGDCSRQTPPLTSSTVPTMIPQRYCFESDCVSPFLGIDLLVCPHSALV